MGTQSINVGRFNQILGRLLSMGGQEDPAGALSPEISPVLVMEADRPEWKFLGNERLVAAQISAVSTAGLAATGRLRNPSTSGVLGIVEGIIFSTTATQRVQVRLGVLGDTGLLTPMVAQAARDSRLTTTVGALRTSSDQVAGVGTVIYEGQLLANTSYIIGVTPIVLAPLSHVDVSGADLVAATISVNFAWRERAAEPFEVK